MVLVWVWLDNNSAYVSAKQHNPVLGWLNAEGKAQ